MIQSFRDRETEELFHRYVSKRWRSIARPALRKLRLIHRSKTLGDLRIPPGNHLEALQGDRAGQHSIRVNDQYRICFRWDRGDAFEVEITDYH
ncbi:MAG: type II toxin-antitoxin system RelE/ParE family toxin [Bryobacteraceae bacterium]|nr:type II toxin-antitoxin system RelE/ParE family toxin [Bryobacteraceae bacterium]